MTKNKDNELKEKILREILCSYMDDDTIDTEITCSSHFTSAIKIAIDDGFEAGRREVLKEVRKRVCDCEFLWLKKYDICGNCAEINELIKELKQRVEE